MLSVVASLFHQESPSSPPPPRHDERTTTRTIELNNETIEERQNYSTAQHIQLDKSITIITGRTFYRCRNLETISIPPTVTKIGIWSFYASSSLRSITIPHSVTSIGKGAFRDCTSLASVHIPHSVRSIGDVCFSNCTALRHVVIPDSVSCIGVSTFAYCESLLSVHLPSSVVDVEKRVFWGCRNLLLIYLPKTVRYVRETTFDDDCDLLERRTMGKGGKNNNSNNNDRSKSNNDKYLNYHFDIITWLRQRFDDLPIHRACYDFTTMLTVDVLSSLIKDHKSTLLATDALGMTAMHILSCNPNVNEDMIRIMRCALSSSSLSSSRNDNSHLNVSDSRGGNVVGDDNDESVCGNGGTGGTGTGTGGDHGSDDETCYKPECPLKLFLMCRNYLDIPPLSSPSLPRSTVTSTSTLTLTLLDLLERGIKCDDLACVFALDSNDEDDYSCDIDIGNDKRHDKIHNRTDEYDHCHDHDKQNDTGSKSTGTCRIDLDLLKSNERTGLLPFMSAAALKLPNCGLEMVYMLAMKDPNVLQQQSKQ